MVVLTNIVINVSQRNDTPPYTHHQKLYEENSVSTVIKLQLNRLKKREEDEYEDRHTIKVISMDGVKSLISENIKP